MPLLGRLSHRPSLMSRAYAASTVAVLMFRCAASSRLEGMRSPGRMLPRSMSPRKAVYSCSVSVVRLLGSRLQVNIVILPPHSAPIPVHDPTRHRSPRHGCKKRFPAGSLCRQADHIRSF